MEFLDINYAEVKPVEVTDSYLNGILFLVDKGLESKEMQDPIALSQELDKDFQKRIFNVGETKPNSQEKAIVTALFSRYPKMLEDKSDVQEFKQHLTNLFKAKEMTDGAVKYLIERLMQPDTLEKGVAKAPAAPAPQVDPSQQESKAQTQKAPQGQSQAAPQESNNSEEDSEFYEEWFSSYDVESDLTDKDFSDMVKDSRECIVSSMKVNPARKFIQGKLMDKELSEIPEGFRRASLFILNKETEYSRGGTLAATSPIKDHANGYDTGDEIIKTNRDKAKSFMLDKRGNLVTQTLEQPKINK